jgi:hypothetical protein
MLYLPPGSGLPVRVHGAFVSDEEVHRVVEYLRARASPTTSKASSKAACSTARAMAPGGGGAGRPAAESDPMYDQAVAVVLQHRGASISLVQRHLRIGYNRAARLLEQMEKSGLVSAMGPTATATCWCRSATNEAHHASAGRHAAGAGAADRPGRRGGHPARLHPRCEDRQRQLHPDRHLARRGAQENVAGQLRVQPAQPLPLCLQQAVRAVDRQ